MKMALEFHEFYRNGDLLLILSYPPADDDVLSLPGCGAYAADSWEMFVLGRQDVAPTDRALLSYRSGHRRVDRMPDGAGNGAAPYIVA